MIEAARQPATSTSESARRKSVFEDKPRSPAADRTSLILNPVVVATFEEAAGHVDAWEDLARSAIEPNVFYESWMLLPAFEELAAGKDVQFVLMYGSDPAHPATPPVLCGLFPLERSSRYRGLPVSVLRFWKHDYCLLCTPLVRADVARQCVARFLDWLAESDNAHLMEFSFMSGDGPLSRVLIDLFNDRRTLVFQSETFTRAVLRRGADGASYLREALSGRHIKDLRRRERHLGETGRIEYDSLEPQGDFEEWVADFARLESEGWKGREGTAIIQHAADSRFFRRIAAGAFRRGRLMMLALRFEDRPIAMKCNLVAGNGAFAFKIAFDESFARFSPGVLLEIDNIHRLHSDPAAEWMDSCAAAAHPMINRLWQERRVIQTTLVSTGGALGSATVSLMPLLRYLNRALRRRSLKKTIGNSQEVS